MFHNLYICSCITCCLIVYNYLYYHALCGTFSEIKSFKSFKFQETRFGPKKKSSLIYLGPKNLDTFWWNCQIIFRWVSIHGRAGFILISCATEKIYLLTKTSVPDRKYTNNINRLWFSPLSNKCIVDELSPLYQTNVLFMNYLPLIKQMYSNIIV